MDVIKEKYYSVEDYDDQYTRWNTLRQERDQTMHEFINAFHAFLTNMAIKHSKWNLVLKYHGGLHWYIQT